MVFVVVSYQEKSLHLELSPTLLTVHLRHHFGLEQWHPDVLTIAVNEIILIKTTGTNLMFPYTNKYLNT